MDLIQRVQSLPPELYNIVLWNVFTPDTDVHEIDQDSKPPELLAVSRATRNIFAGAYYGGRNSIFVFKRFSLQFDTVVIRWLKALQPSHLKLLRQMWVVVNDEPSGLFHEVAWKSFHLDHHGLGALSDRLVVEAHAKDKDGNDIMHRT